MRLAITTFTTLVSVAGCLPHDATSGDDDDVGGGTTTYQVTSRIDITIEALLPQPVEDIVLTAREFSINPAHTMISLADSAGIPAVGTLRDYLPDYVEGKLEGWINDEVAKLTIAGVPVTEVAGHFAALAETTLTQVSLESELTISGGRATHRLTSLDLAPTGIDQQLALGGFPSEVVAATTTATTSKGTLALGAHTFGLAYGEYAWRAIESACTAEYGADIRTTLGAASDCPSLADRVANKCVFGVCVGHRAELTEICEAGLDEVVDRIHDNFSELRFDAIAFSAGTAKVTSTGLSNGLWTAEINAGMGLRHVAATFTAER